MSDCEKILSYAKVHGYITTWDAIKMFRCTRCPARIHDLRRHGHMFDTVMIEVTDDSGETTRYAKYYYRGFNGYNGKGA